MEVMRKKKSINQSINLSENCASWLMMMMMMLKGYVEDAQKSRVKHEAARRKLFFVLAVVQLSVAHMRLTAVFVKSKKNREEEEALNKNCSS